MKKYGKFYKVFSMILAIILEATSVSVIAEPYAGLSEGEQSSKTPQTAPWYESIPAMLSAGEYEEGVVIAGINMSLAETGRDPLSILGPEQLEDNAELVGDPLSVLATEHLEENAEILMTVDADVFETEFAYEEAAYGIETDGLFPYERQIYENSLKKEYKSDIYITEVRRNDLSTAELLELLAGNSCIVFAEPNYVKTVTPDQDVTDGTDAGYSIMMPAISDMTAETVSTQTHENESESSAILFEDSSDHYDDESAAVYFEEESDEYADDSEEFLTEDGPDSYVLESDEIFDADPDDGITINFDGNVLQEDQTDAVPDSNGFQAEEYMVYDSIQNIAVEAEPAALNVGEAEIFITEDQNENYTEDISYTEDNNAVGDDSFFEAESDFNELNSLENAAGFQDDLSSVDQSDEQSGSDTLFPFEGSTDKETEEIDTPPSEDGFLTPGSSEVPVLPDDEEFAMSLEENFASADDNKSGNPDASVLQWGMNENSTLHVAGKTGAVSMNIPGWPDGSDMDHEIIVAVMDAPVDFSNPDLQDAAYTFSPELRNKLRCDTHGFNALWDAADGRLEYYENEGSGVGDHGSHVAGIIGAAWNGEGISGVASNVKIISVQNCSPGGETSLINSLRGMNFIKEAKENGVDIRVVNNSWVLSQTSKALDAAVTELGRHGIVSIFAAGNDGCDLNVSPKLAGTLADNPYAVIVASTTPSGQLSNFSSFGKGIVTLGAPGESIFSCLQTSSASYIPMMAGQNRFYENFEDSPVSMSICQLDSATGEKIEGTDGLVVSGNDEMGFEGLSVFKVPLDPTRKGGWNSGKTVLQIDFGDVSKSGITYGDSLGFAFGGKTEFSAEYIVDTASGTSPYRPFSSVSKAGCMNLLEYALPEGINQNSLSFNFQIDTGNATEIYFDTFGIGSEKQPYGFKSGTSMAAPAVTGAAAVLASRHFSEIAGANSDAASAEMLADLVRSSVRPLPSLRDCTSTGGIIDLSADAYADETTGRQTPIIKDVSVNGSTITLAGTGFGAATGNAVIRKYVVGRQDTLDTVIQTWTDSSVTLQLAEDFKGIIEAVLTAANGKKDTIIRFISKSDILFETDHRLGSDPGEPFEFNVPDSPDTGIEAFGDLETAGLLIAGDDRLYYMPQAAKLERLPVLRSMYSYDPATDSWSSCPEYPAWIRNASAVWYHHKLYVKGTATETDESGTTPYYDPYAIEDTGTVMIYSYTPGDENWVECAVTGVRSEYTLFEANEKMMLAGISYGNDVPAQDGSWPFFREYDPSEGASEPLGFFDREIMSPIAVSAGGSIYIIDPHADTPEIAAFDGNQYAAQPYTIGMPDYYFGESAGKNEGNHFLENGTYTFAACGDTLIFAGPPAKDGSSDTYILRSGETALCPLDKRISDAGVYQPCAAAMGGRLYVIGASFFEPGKRVFRSTFLKDPGNDLKAQNGVPLIVIRIDETDLHQTEDGKWFGSIEDLNASSDHSVRCEGTLEFLLPEEGYLSPYGGSVPSGVPISLDYIRGRGNSTWLYHEKKPYKIQFEEKLDLFGMGKSKEWALMANSTDKTQMKNRLTSWLGEKFGLPYSPQMVPVDVVMIGSKSGRKDLGSYDLSELVSIEDFRVAIPGLGKNVISEEGDPNLTGGYLLSVFNLLQDGNKPESTTFKLNSGLMLTNEDPAFENEAGLTDGQKAQREYIRSYLQAVDDLIMKPDAIDAETHQAISSKLDLRSAAKYWLVQEFSQNVDAFNTSSTYLYKDRNGKLAFGPLWDFDLAWGELEYLSFYDGSVPGFNFTCMDWIDALRSKDPLFIEIIEQEWAVMESCLQEMIKDGGIIDEYKEEQRASRDADYTIWAEAENYTTKDYDQLIGSLKYWITMRMNWVSENLDELSNCFVSFTLESDDGEPLGVLSVRKDGYPKYEPAPPVKEGYVFTGWFEKNTHNRLAYVYADQDHTFVAEYLEDAKAVKPEALYFSDYDYWIPMGEIFSESSRIMFYPEDTTNKRITWTSSDPSVLAVDETGKVSGMAVGEAVLTGTLHNGVSNSCTVHVYDRSQTVREMPDGMDAVPEKTTLSPGQVQQILARFTPEGKYFINMNISVTSGDPNIAEIIHGGDFGQIHLVKGIKEGKTTITVTATDKGSGQSFTSSFDVTVSKGGQTEPAEPTDPTKPTDPTEPTKPIDPTKPLEPEETEKAAQPMTVKTKAVSVKYNETKSQKIERTKAFIIKKAQGIVSFRKKRGSSALSIDSDGNITVKKGTKPGAYQMTVIVTAGGNSNYKKGKKTVTVKVNVKKAAQPMTVKTKKVSLQYRKSEEQKIRRAEAFSIRNAKGSVTFKKTGGSRYLSINSKGQITAKKGIKKGTHKIKVTVTASGNKYYKRGKKTVVVKVKMI